MAHPELLLTPSSLEFWGQFLLTSLLLAFLLHWRISGGIAEFHTRTRYLVLALLFYVLGLILLILHVSTLKTERMPSIAMMYPAAVAALFVFGKFVYRMPSLPAAWRREERIATQLIFALVVWEFGYGIFRLLSLARGRLHIRSQFQDTLTLLVISWLMIVLVRQALRADEKDGAGASWQTRLRRVSTTDAQATRALLIVLVLMFLLNAGNAAQSWLGISRNASYFWTSLISLTALVSTILVYVNYYALTGGLVVQVTGVIVMLIVLVISVAGRSATNAFTTSYTGMTIQTPARTIRFTPVAPSSYRAEVLPLAPGASGATEAAPGRMRTRLVAPVAGAMARVELPIAFPFFGQAWTTIYVDPGGFLTFGAPQRRIDIEYRYGAVPAIFALYRSMLESPAEDSAPATVTVASRADQVRVRWSSALQAPTETESAGALFQIVLNADGAFAIEHLSIAPTLLTPYLLATNEWIWRVGITDGNVNRMPQHVAWADVAGEPIHATGTTIDDAELTIRRLIHPIHQQLAVLMFMSILMAAGSIPLFLRAGFMQPLERLLRAIERTQHGDLTVQVPIHFSGEIATITRNFNRLVASQRNLLENLEAQVHARTQLLELTNQELQGEIQLRRQVQLDLEELNRELDARVQERTHALSQSEERFRRVVTSISDQVYAVTIDPLTRTVGDDYLSPGLKAMLGIQHTDGADLLVRLRMQHVAQKDLANFDAHIASLFRGCDSEVDYRFIMPDGTQKWVRASVRCERVSPAQIRCYGVISDISDRKQLERETAARMALQEVEQLRTAWLSNMSHELRTPLGLIKAAATTLLATDVTIPSSMQQPILEQLDYETDRLTDLINALLDLSCVDAGRLHLTYSETDVAGILREVCAAATLQMQISALPPFTLELVIDPPTQVAVVDRERIRRVLQNLLSNAMKFAPDDSLIALRAHASAAHICIEVEDHGIGIDAADQERIFERYYQVDNPGLRSHNGVGLGLPICREIVDAHGGSISLKSQRAGTGLASGTTITVCVPRMPPTGRKG